MLLTNSSKVGNVVQTVFRARRTAWPVGLKLNKNFRRNFSSTINLKLQYKLRSINKHGSLLIIVAPILPVSRGPWLNTQHRLYSGINVTLELPDEPHRLLIIQPSPKFGPIPKPFVKPADKLEEAIALAEAVTGWKVVYQRIDNVRNAINSEHYFGTGKIAELKSEVRNLGDQISAVFINVPKLTPLQHKTFRTIFKRMYLIDLG